MKLRPHLDLNVNQVQDLLQLLEQRDLTDSDTFKYTYFKLNDYLSQIIDSS